jgi:hypothetical protein
MHIEWRNERDREKTERLAMRNRVTARRMLWLKAATNFLDLEPPSHGRAHFLKHEFAGCFAIDLESKTRPVRLICLPIGDFKMKDGQFVKESITQIEIVKIEENYHKK